MNIVYICSEYDRYEKEDINATVAVNPIISSTCLMHARYLDSSARFSVSSLVQCFEKLNTQDSGVARTQPLQEVSSTAYQLSQATISALI
jgi:hypothetical protein